MSDSGPQGGSAPGGTFDLQAGARLAVPEEVSLVLTDVVDSTRLAAVLGDAHNGALWDTHDQVARGLVGTWNGREVERTDGILVLFREREAALGFARDYLAELARAAPELEARVGIHRGPLVVRANPTDHIRRGAKVLEADGLALSVAARVAAVARGRQILMTDSARIDGEAASSQGFWNLKGAPEPLELFALDDQATASMLEDGEKAFRVVRDGDHWIPVHNIPKTLPAEWDGFFGREDALRGLRQTLGGETRLVTLTGVGGIGKTRLACRFAWSTLADYPGGCWFCDLSDARDAADVIRGAAVALGVPIDAVDAADQIGRAMAGRGRALIILDNFEQLVGAARETVGRWLSLAPRARFLLTSRERLDLPGEFVFSLELLAAEAAVRLFKARATAVKPDFKLEPGDDERLTALVRQLDFLPLAIELAAPRVRVMSTAELLERLTSRLAALDLTGRRDKRQANLRANLDWSWELLDAAGQGGLAQLSVFEGGFTRAAAEAILDVRDPIRVLEDLVDRSLVRPLEGQRFDLLRLVKDYASERLAAREERLDVEARHGRYYAGRATTSIDEQLAVARDLDNVVAACHRAVARGDAEVALTTLRMAWAVTDRQGPLSLAAQLATEVGDLPGLKPGLRDRLKAEAMLASGSYIEGQKQLRVALRALGYPEPRSLPALMFRIVSRVLRQVWRRRVRRPLLPFKGDAEVRMAATRAYQRLVETYWFESQPPRMLGSALSALDLCEPLGPSPELARAHATLALASSGLRFDEVADRYAALAREAAEGSGAPVAEAYVRFLASVYRIGLGRFEEVEKDLKVALPLFEQVEDRRLLGDARTVAALAHQYQGRFERAREGFEEVLSEGRRLGNRQHQVWGLLGVGDTALRLGCPEVGHRHVLEALEVLEAFPSVADIARATGLLSRLELELGRGDEAERQADEAERRFRALGPPAAHYLFEGYASVAEVRVLGHGPSGRAMRLMRRYAQTFPIGEARLAWLEAEGLRRRGRGDAAGRKVAQGRAKARALGMWFEVERFRDTEA